jgi:hypothetical protein
MDETHFARSAGVTEKAVGRDVALYVSEHHSIHVLNPTARFIWESLVEPMTFDEILLMMTEAFDADADVMKQDLRDALDRFTELGLVATTTADDGAAGS